MNMANLKAASLPKDFSCDLKWEKFDVDMRTKVSYPTLKISEWQMLLKVLRDSEKTLKRKPVRDLVQIIGRVAERFLDPGDPIRSEALKWLPPTSGISLEMAEVVLERMAKNWTSECLIKLLERELKVPGVLDGFQELDSGRKVRAIGPALSFHIGAGTVPGVSVSSMIRALLVKSTILLKPSKGDIALPVLFAKALAEEDLELTTGIAVLYWPGGDNPAEEVILNNAEVVLAYGSTESVLDLKNRTPVTANFVPYYHRVSLGMIGRDALNSEEAVYVAKNTAVAVSMFDQRGCVSPHVLYVECGGDVNPKAWAGILAEEMARVEIEIPSGNLTINEAGSLQQVCGAAAIQESSGSDVKIYIGDQQCWAVIYQGDPGFTVSCQNRVVYVKPVSDLTEVPGLLHDFQSHLQTVAITGAGNRREDIATELGLVGVTRVTSFEHAPWPPLWWHHDGKSVLEGLIRWVDLENE